jgi:hypothetical protein
VSEELGIERGDDHAGRSSGLLVCGDPSDEVGKVSPVVTDLAEGGSRFVGALRPKVHIRTRHAPQLQATGPTDLVELEVPLVAWVAVVPTPDLHRRLGIAHECGHDALGARRRHAIGAVRRAGGLGIGARVRVVAVQVEALLAERRVTVVAERGPSPCEVGVGEEVPKARPGQLLFDAWPPPRPRPVGAFRQPTADGVTAEQPLVLVPADQELEPDALVTREQGEIAVRRRGADDLERSGLLEPPERADDIALDGVKQVAESLQVRLPELDERGERGVTRRGERGRGFAPA